MSVAVYLAVALGGALGSVARFSLSRGLAAVWPGFPVGTLAVNLLGSFLIGILAVWAFDKNIIVSPWREFFITGFLGGLTTFSTFAYENAVLLQSGRYRDLFLYLAGNLLLGFLLVVAGRALGRI